MSQIMRSSDPMKAVVALFESQTIVEIREVGPSQEARTSYTNLHC